MKILHYLRTLTICAVIAMISSSCKSGDTKNSQSAAKDSAITQKPSAATATKVSGPLDGMYFEGMVGAAGNPDGGNDIANFYDGMFTTSYLRGQGFRPATYTVQVADSITTFHAEWTDANLGTLSWDGKISGDSLTSTGIYAPLTGDSIKYWWDGVASSVDSISARHLTTRRGAKPTGPVDSTKPH